jgi:membrane-associated phospholipid phosphatase
MKTYRLIFMMISLSCICFIQQVYPQSSSSDSSSHPYHIDYWGTGIILGVGSLANYLGTPGVRSKADLSLWEIQELNRGDVHGIDTWSLKLDPSNRRTFFNYSNYTLWSTLALPASFLFDHRIKRDLFDMLLMYLKTITIATNIYEWSFLGPNFQDRMRPITYYDQVPYNERKQGDNRNSFFSGHTTSAAATTFFLVKVYSDYHPEIGNNKYLLYGAALIPPLLVGYFRMKALMHFPSDVMVGLGVGALCGIFIPELHRLKDKNISLEAWASFCSSGIGMKW